MLVRVILCILVGGDSGSGITLVGVSVSLVRSGYILVEVSVTLMKLIESRITTMSL